MTNTLEPPRTVTAVAGPSLALTKYWGKHCEGVNRPATPSVGVTLSTFQSTACVTLTDGQPRITVNNVPQPLARFQPFLDEATRVLGPRRFDAVCTNNFPTAAGLASSSSGFAALATAATALSGRYLSQAEISALARVGSGSAARAVYHGFTEFPAGAEYAEPLYGPDYWPALRIVACLVDHEPKSVSSRQGMARVQATSPYFQSWVQDAALLHREALAALEERDLEKLGAVMRLSYLRMFSTQFSACPPLLYWQPSSIQIIQHLEQLRRRGLGVWETMDAGPQVKLFCLDTDLHAVTAGLKEVLPSLETVVATVGNGPCLSTSLKD
jgi:diphosphomevalonate decarboxylase